MPVKQQTPDTCGLQSDLRLDLSGCIRLLQELIKSQMTPLSSPGSPWLIPREPQGKIRTPRAIRMAARG